jgi:hypothetical protein
MIRRKPRPNWQCGSHERVTASLPRSAGRLEKEDEGDCNHLPRSNGHPTFQIARLSLVKRQMYGRAKIDILKATLSGTSHKTCAKLRQAPIARLGLNVSFRQALGLLERDVRIMRRPEIRRL